MIIARMPPYPPAEIVRRGEEVYAQQIRPQVEADNKGRALVIDIETGAWEWEDRDEPLAASHRLITRNPDAVLYARRVGYRARTKMGGSLQQVEE
jgi:hypothetical protein